jgi:hypothetical protein
MTCHRWSSRVSSTALGAIAVVAATCLVGCGSSDVGTAPSSRQQQAAYVAKEAEQQQSKTTGRTAGPAPQSIKSKLFKAKAGQAE